MRIAIVAARFNGEITDVMTRVAEERVAKLCHELVATVRVPGAFDTPLVALRLAERPDVDGVVVLGAVITGETDHDQVLMHATARSLQEVSLRTGKPVTLGITGPGMTHDEAAARVGYAEAAVDACAGVFEALAKAKAMHPDRDHRR